MEQESGHCHRLGRFDGTLMTDLSNKRLSINKKIRGRGKAREIYCETFTLNNASHFSFLLALQILRIRSSCLRLFSCSRTPFSCSVELDFAHNGDAYVREPDFMKYYFLYTAVH